MPDTAATVTKTSRVAACAPCGVHRTKVLDDHVVVAQIVEPRIVEVLSSAVPKAKPLTVIYLVLERGTLVACSADADGASKLNTMNSLVDVPATAATVTDWPTAVCIPTP